MAVVVAVTDGMAMVVAMNVVVVVVVAVVVFVAVAWPRPSLCLWLWSWSRSRSLSWSWSLSKLWPRCGDDCGSGGAGGCRGEGRSWWDVTAKLEFLNGADWHMLQM